MKIQIRLRTRDSLRLFIVLSMSIAPLLAWPSHAAQRTRREHLTPPEIELVRDAQELDRRTRVFIKAAERRLQLLSDPQAAQSKPAQKEKKDKKDKADKEDMDDTEAWGAPPTGTRAELLSDLASIFDEAITNIDDTATRHPSNSSLTKALKRLSEASTRFLVQLTPMRSTATADDEREALEQAIEELQEIIEAGKKASGEKSE